MGQAVETQRGHDGGGTAAAHAAAPAPAAGKATLSDGAAHESAGASSGAAAATGAPKAHPATAVSFVTDAFSSGGDVGGGLSSGGGGDEEKGEVLGGAATVASTTNTKAARWKPHGQFSWWVRWRTDGRTGWIVQRITNTYSGTDAAGTAITMAGLGVVPTYYESWAVSAGGNISPANGSTNDMWERPALGNGSRGRWSMRGDVYWTDTDPATSGHASHGVSNAGVLVSGLTAPAGLGSVLVTRTANGAWDSTGARPTHTGSAA